MRLGLDDEWIASWNANALKAGAIAYRSYGVYHVYHPRDANFDICSTTCCQVLNPSTSNVNTDNATTATSGMIVVDSTGDNPFFAEYAAENNDNFCADGFTGSPSFNWPCMSDPVTPGKLLTVMVAGCASGERNGGQSTRQKTTYGSLTTTTTTTVFQAERGRESFRLRLQISLSQPVHLLNR